MPRCARITLCFVVTLLATASLAQNSATSSVPNLIRYGGTLKDERGGALTSTVGVTFAVYKQQDGSAPIWQETQNITPDSIGQYSVLLGTSTAAGLPEDLFRSRSSAG